MKKQLLLSVFAGLFALSAKSQCTMNCANFTSVIGNINQSYNGDRCFISSGAVFTNNVNINNWSRLSFQGNFVLNMPINMFNQKKVYFSGNNSVKYISMSGGDTVYCDANIAIQTLISNNSHINPNAIITQTGIAYNNSYYQIGDTIKTGSGVGNWIIVSSCAPSIPLNIQIYEFGYRNNNVFWNAKSDQGVTLEESTNGADWVKLGVFPDIYEYKLNLNFSGYKFFRISSGQQYSSVIKVLGKADMKYSTFDFYGNKIPNNSNGLQIRRYEDGSIEKINRL